jgi:GAF domain-containing protein
MALPMDPLRAFAELSRIKFSETNLDGVAARITDLARNTLPGADGVSITIIQGRQARTAAATADLVRSLDEAQYDRGSGPALQAAQANTTVHVADTSIETRWDGWAAHAGALGIRATLSVGMPIRDTVRGAVTIYSRNVAALHGDTVQLTQTFAGYAAVALANAYLYDSTATLADQLRTAMEHRAVIEQAKGIIMSERRCSSEEAFAILTKLSQDTNRKLRDIASALVARTAGPAQTQAGGLPTAAGST